MKLVISSGHGTKVRGASGYLDEVDEAIKVMNKVAELLRQGGHDVKIFTDTTSTSQDQNLYTIVDYHNRQTRDLDVSVHFNAYQTTSKPMGTEVLYVTQADLASVVSDRIAVAADLPDRGAKYRGDLYFLNNTEEPAVLLEVVFVDSSTDAAHYNGNFNAICEAIAEGLTGMEIGDQPVDPPVEIPPEEPGSGENRVDIEGLVQGDVKVIINDVTVYGGEHVEPNVVRMDIKTTGDVVVTINGEDLHNKPPATGSEISENHTDIECTVFGGGDDPNYSAYPPYDSNGNGALLDGDHDPFVALPYSFDLDLFPDNAPRVRVYYGNLSAVGAIADKGPWVVDDDDYVMGSERPLAETCHDEGTPLPRGPNKGKVPSNAAGIDISPALARMIGLEGKGRVDWSFEQ